MLERKVMDGDRSGAITLITVLTTVGLFGVLVFINGTAENLEIPKSIPDKPVVATVQPPELPTPPVVDRKQDKPGVARTIPSFEAAPTEQIEIPSMPLTKFTPENAGFELGGLTAITAPPLTYDPMELDNRPEALQRIAPEYPYEMKRAGVDGWARIEFIVEEDGSVNEARVAAASDREFGEAGLKAVRNWRFKPGMMDGQPVRTRMIQPFDFRADR